MAIDKKKKAQAPTLNKKQLNLTLSAKKQKKVTIKNVLADPFANFWPLLKPDDSKSVTEMLEKCLPRIKKDKLKVPWEKIKVIPKAERKAFRESYTKQERTESVVDESLGAQAVADGKENNNNTSDNERGELMLGVNKVTRALEEKNINITSVLIANDVTPRFMVRHVIDMCVLHNVPVLVLHDLRSTLQKCCGVSSIVAAVGKSINKEMKLFELYQTIKTISGRYPPPQNHVNFKRRIENLVTEESLGIQDVMDSKENDNSSHSMEVEKVERNSDSKKKEEEENEEEILKQVYLVRRAEGEDVFVPPYSGCGGVSSGGKMDVDTSFMGFTDTNENLPVPAVTATAIPPSDNTKQIGKVTYRSLVIKRLKGDVNRNKRKIDKLKKN